MLVVLITTAVVAVAAAPLRVWAYHNPCAMVGGFSHSSKYLSVAQVISATTAPGETDDVVEMICCRFLPLLVFDRPLRH